MKRKHTFFFAAIFVALLYCWLRFSFGIFTPYNFFTAKQDIDNGKIIIIEAGEMPLNFKQKKTLANNFSFDFELTGCLLNTDKINGIKYYNNRMIQELEHKFGTGWWSKFQHQLDSIDRQQIKEEKITKVLILVENQKSVKNQIRLIDSLSKGQRHVSLIPSLYDTTNNIYLVKVGEDNGVNFVCYFNFFVNADSMKLTNPNLKN